jgi:hypothetical protein
MYTTNTDVGVCSHHGCLHEHNVDKMAICRSLLYKGSCPSGEYCDLSHKLSPHNVPSCLHFQEDRCTKDDCRFGHVSVSHEALNCVAFGVTGYCEKGATCTELHLRECPFFTNKGYCIHADRCRLGHVRRASRMKKASPSKARYYSPDSYEDRSSEALTSPSLGTQEHIAHVADPEARTAYTLPSFTQELDFVPLVSEE